MQIVNTHLSDIASGYERIRQAEVGLQSKWRTPLLESYAEQRAAYEEELYKYHRHRADFSRRLRLGVWMASALRFHHNTGTLIFYMCDTLAGI